MKVNNILEVLKTDANSMSILEKLLGGIATAALSMVVVFIILLLISFIIRIINTSPLDNEIENKVNTNEKSNCNVEKKDEIDEELVSVITAAIIQSSGKNIVVKRITRTNNNKTNWEKTYNV
jgi:Na+-transporting methylmalonyl-CoA/oxaloacetate decarboxylase gamma subunit